MKPEALQQLLREQIKAAYHIDVLPQLSETEPQFGDYATNVAFQLVGRLKQSPQAIAQELATKITHPEIAGAAAAGNGYINITLSDHHWLEQFKMIKPDFGQSRLGQGQKVQVEFISANPTGPLTLGNGRGGYYGDVLANVLAWTGHEVSREYYINDAGNQVQALKDSVWVAISRQLKLENEMEPGYLGEYIDDIAADIVSQIKQRIPAQQRSALTYGQVMKFIDAYDVLGQTLGWIKASVKRMGIDFDVWFSEASLHAGGAVEAALAKLKAAKALKTADGAVWLKGQTDERDRVLVKADGSYTYLASDLAYHYDKFVKRRFEKVINLWGADHGAQVASLVGGVEQLGISGQLDIVLFQLVRLIRGGKEVKVSKRAGTYVTIDELLEQVEPSIARFFFIMRGANTQMDFDLDLAKEQSQKNPYHYVMYAYVRAQSILKKAAERNLKPSAVKELIGVERELVRQMAKLPKLLEQIAGDYGVQRLAFYGIDVARLFHDYYETVPVLSAESDSSGQRLAFVAGFSQFMEAYFKILGIIPVSRM